MAAVFCKLVGDSFLAAEAKQPRQKRTRKPSAKVADPLTNPDMYQLDDMQQLPTVQIEQDKQSSSTSAAATQATEDVQPRVEENLQTSEQQAEFPTPLIVTIPLTPEDYQEAITKDNYKLHVPEHLRPLWEDARKAKERDPTELARTNLSLAPVAGTTQ